MNSKLLSSIYLMLVFPMGNQFFQENKNLKTNMDDLNIAEKDKLFVIKSNIENSFTFSNGEIIIFSNSSSGINDFINENNSSLFLVSSFNSYSVVKVRNIDEINFIFDQLLKDKRFIGAQLNSINPYLEPR